MGHDEKKLLSNLSPSVLARNAGALEPPKGKTRLERLAEEIAVTTPPLTPGTGTLLAGPGGDPMRVNLLRENDLQLFVRDLCKRLGFKHYHTFDSRRSDEGFPDSVISGKGRLIVAELKVNGEGPTDEQVAWLDDFASHAETHLWTEEDLDEIMNILLGQVRYEESTTRWTLVRSRYRRAGAAR